MSIRSRIAVALIAKAMKTPYSHLQREDGTYYMRRYWLVPYNYIPSFGPTGCGQVSWSRPIARILQHFNIAIRIHHIMAPDRDWHMHDHPWRWASWVLKGHYFENRPAAEDSNHKQWSDGREAFECFIRQEGDFAINKAGARHAITQVPDDGVWTLFITFKKTNEWGFYTEAGKIHHREYESAHQTEPTA